MDSGSLLLTERPFFLLLNFPLAPFRLRRLASDPVSRQKLAGFGESRLGSRLSLQDHYFQEMPTGLAAVPQAQLPSKYQDVIKIALKPRQSRSFFLALIGWHLLLTSALLSTLSLSVLTPVTLICSCLSFAVGVLPLLVSRKRGFSTTSAPPPRLAATRAAQISATLSSPKTWRLVYQHALAFVVLAAAYCLLLAAKSGGWGPQIWIESHNAFYTNERFLFLLGHAAMLGAIYTLLFRVNPSVEIASLPSFDASLSPSEPLPSLKDRVLQISKARFASAALVGLISGSLSVLVYSVLRIRIWRFLLVLFGTRGIARRILIPSFRVDFGFFEVTVRTTLFSIAAVCCIEMAYLLLDVYLSHPLPPVSRYSKHPNKLLIDGINDPIVFFSSHAYSELARLSATDADARAAIYKDVNLDGAAWPRIRDGCLKLIDAQKEFLSKRGQIPASTSAVAAKAPTSAASKSPPGQPPKRSVWDMLAAGEVASSESAATKATQTTTAANQQAPQAPSSTSSSTTTQQAMASWLLKAIQTGWKLVPADAKHVLFGPRRQQELIGESPNSAALSIAGRDSARLAWAIQALSELLCRSLEEDPYGSVQKDIRRVLGSLTDLSTEVRNLGSELEKKAISIDEKLSKLEQEDNSAGGWTSQKGSDGDGNGVGGTSTSKRAYAQKDLRQAWVDSGAQNVDLCLSLAMRNILGTFGRFDLQLGNELEVKLTNCLS